MGFIETHMRKSQRHFNGTSLKHFTIEDVGNVFWSQKHFFEMFCAGAAEIMVNELSTPNDQI